MIEILSRKALLIRVSCEPQVHNVIIISEDFNETKNIEPLCKDWITFFFDDVINPQNPNAPAKSQVNAAIEWARDKSDLIVSCKAGICRSSAIAFLIAYDRDPKTAIQTLNPLIHYPNELVIEHGISILGESIRPIIEAFYRESEELYREAML